MIFPTTLMDAHNAHGSCDQTRKENEGNADRAKRAAGSADRLDALSEMRRHLDRQNGVGAGEVPHLRRQTEASGSRVLIRLAFSAETLKISRSSRSFSPLVGRGAYGPRSGVKRTANCSASAPRVSGTLPRVDRCCTKNHKGLEKSS